MKSRVWFDILTPKQVLFFAPIVKELASRGAEVLATSRDYREVKPVAEMCGLELELVGKRGGKSLLEQLTVSTERQMEMISLVTAFKPDVAVSVASAVCSRIAFGVRIPHIAVNDSPHSQVANRLSLPLSKLLLCPWVIPPAAWKQYGVAASQVRQYHALDPAVWLKRKPVNGPVPRLSSKRKAIVVRLEESYAPYLIGSDESWAYTVLDSIADEFPDCNLVALCRYPDQVKAVQKDFGSKYVVPDEFVDGRRLLEATDLFVGMGGTMSAEAALMGVPTISAFQGSYLIERYLDSSGLLVKARSRGQLVRNAKKCLKNRFRLSFEKRAKLALEAMEDPVPLIVDSILGNAAQA